MIQPFKYDLGLFTNNFDPLTLGHLNIIYKSASECKDLYIILNYSEDDLNKQKDEEYNPALFRSQ